MFYVYYGNSPTQVRAEAYAHADSLQEKGRSLLRIDADSFQAGAIEDAAMSSTLFGDKMLYVLDTPSSHAAFNEEVFSLLPALQTSEHVFVVIEETLLAAPKKTYATYAAEMFESKEEKDRGFNVFALADSLARKDKKTLWLGLCEAKLHGLAAEEIIGTLWWQLKTLQLASLSKTAEEVGMKDFPYTKAKRALPLFKQGEINALASSLMRVYHQGHQGEVDIDLALEHWTLSL